MNKLVLAMILIAAPAAAFSAGTAIIDTTDGSCVVKDGKADCEKKENALRGLYGGFDIRFGPARADVLVPGREMSLSESGMAFGMHGGKSLSDNFRIGGEFGWSGISKDDDVPVFLGSKKGETHKINAFYAMPHLIAEIKIWRFAPYVGAGFGLSFLIPQFDDYKSSDGVWVYEKVQKTESGTAMNFTYALMAGLRIEIIPGRDLNVGYRRQDYSAVTLLGNDSKFSAKEYSIGMTARF
jgi:opacity protein-like surface antigen